jgi:crotonobetainyl-CoA:carnitine CoA-transferase CaiB-like acyl-CoA transferase
MYEAADGPLIIAVGNNSQFDKFCRQVIMRPDIVEDQRFSTSVNRARTAWSCCPCSRS